MLSMSVPSSKIPQPPLLLCLPLYIPNHNLPYQPQTTNTTIAAHQYYHSSPPIPAKPLTSVKPFLIKNDNKHEDIIGAQGNKINGILYKCGYEYTWGHVCRRSQNYNISGKENEESGPPINDKELVTVMEVEDHMTSISLNSLEGQPNPQTLKITGYVGKDPSIY